MNIEKHIKYSSGCSIVVEFWEAGTDGPFYDVFYRRYFSLTSINGPDLLEKYHKARKYSQGSQVKLHRRLKKHIVEKLIKEVEVAKE